MTQTTEVANRPEKQSTGANTDDPPIIVPDAATPITDVPSQQSPPPDTDVIKQEKNDNKTVFLLQIVILGV